ncbi:hypothetical protein [Kineosporia sp. A_224]|uniref:glycoside hydrolase family 38 N-terminal domain-containing protein n=1 Tax=Kineosporia sp. A_224 TaxID=1962180 RepID=UPI0013046955|nr:hypothetical protein [Kineosporia sp. A_224]
MKAVLVPHSHWDREWYEPFAVFKLRLRDTLDSVLDLLGSETGFTHFHLDGQSVMLEDYLGMRPERAEEVAGHVRAGRLSIGPFYTLSDEFLVSGEGIIRNLEKGLEQAAAYGIDTPVDGPWAGYMPDQFGHIGQFPQILRMFGIERAVILRGAPASLHRSEFVWRSPNGSEVLTDYLINGYYVGADVGHPKAGIDPDYLSLDQAMERVASVSDRDVLLLPVGADHSTPVPGSFDRVLELAQHAPYDVEVGSLARFLELAGRPSEAQVWTGELRAASTWVLLPNTVASRAYQKRRRGLLESRLERYAEPLSALVPGVPWPAERLAVAWRDMMLNAGHDCAYGAAADAVAHDVDARFDAVEGITEGLIFEAATALAADAAPGVLRWNPSPFEREGVPGLGWGVVARDEIPLAEPVVLTVVDGHVVLDDGTALFVTDEDDDGDLFTFCAPEGGTPRQPTGVTSTATGARFQFDGVALELDAARREGERFIRLSVRVDNRRDDHRLRLWVGLGETATGSVALSPYEIVERPLVGEGFASEIGSPTWPARGAVLAGGTALLTEGVVEYEVDGDRLGVTLLRSVGVIAKPMLATRPIWAGPSVPAPEGQCRGESRYELAVLPEAVPGELVEQWERFALPLLETTSRGGGVARSGQLLRVDGAHLSSVRRVDGELEVRLWNQSPDELHVTVGGSSTTLAPFGIETVLPPTA